MPPWVTPVTSNIMKRLETERKKFDKNSSLSHGIKVQQREFLLNEASVVDQAIYEHNLVSDHKFSAIHKYMKCVQKPCPIPHTVFNGHKGRQQTWVQPIQGVNRLGYSHYSTTTLPVCSRKVTQRTILVTSQTRISLGGWIFTEQNVSAILEKLNPAKSQGPDAIPNRLLKKPSDSPLTVSQSNSLDMCKQRAVYRALENSTSLPGAQSGNRSNIKNYRPIALLNCVSKVFEKTISDALYKQVEQVLSRKQ